MLILKMLLIAIVAFGCMLLADKMKKVIIWAVKILFWLSPALMIAIAFYCDVESGIAVTIAAVAWYYIAIRRWLDDRA